MSALNLIPIRMATALFISSLLLSACSSSSDSQSSTGNEAIDTDETSMIADDDTAANATGGATNDAETVSSSSGGAETITPMVDPINQDPISQDPVIQDPIIQSPVFQDPATQSPINSNPAVPDPNSQNLTRVNFDIQVPAYQSNDLQVSLSWGQIAITAAWVGDEFWSASDDFPTDTEQPLVVTFSDANGDITLGSFETVFKTGVNASMSYQITADQFDTNSWDSDNDGVSNLAELITGSASTKSKRVLLFSETRGFRHESIAVALAALEELAASAGIQADRADDSSGLFNTTNLANYDAVVWVLTSGDVLNNDEQSAFENYIRSGGGYAGIHAASDTEYEWPWYGALVGAYFARHPEIQTASQNIEDASHPSTAHLNLTWTRTDEWYDYSVNPRAQVNVLLSLDEDSYTGGEMGDDHPSAWYHAYDGGRSWYTGGGHTSASYAEPDFRAHLLGGLLYVAGQNGL